MTDTRRPDDEGSLVLIVRRRIRASAERLFAAWTEAAHLERWWGPAGVTCVEPEVDLRPGGAYRIGNLLPDGTTVWISGVFEVITPPTELVYSWRVEPGEHPTERVRVRFEQTDDHTEVVVVHERIPDQPTFDNHQHGWAGCLDGLEAFVTSS